MSAYLLLRNAEGKHKPNAGNVPKALAKRRDLAEVIHSDVCECVC